MVERRRKLETLHITLFLKVSATKLSEGAAEVMNNLWRRRKEEA